MLNDGDVQVRVATIEALAGLKNARAIAALKIALDDKVAEVRFAAAKALLKLNDPAGRESLIAMLNGETKVSSGVVAANVRDTKRTLETPNGATKVTLRVGTTLAPVPYLGVGYSATEKMVTRRGGPGRAATALLLAKDKDPEVIAALRNALTDKDANVRAAAVQALAQVADPDSAELFVTMFSDKNQKVRVQAAASYIRLENPSATGTVAVDEE
jgi:HEAT repeat protein